MCEPFLFQSMTLFIGEKFSLSALTIAIKMRADVLSSSVCGLGDSEAAFEQVAVFVFGRSVRFGLVLLPKPQLGDGAAQAGIVAEAAEMALVERLQDGTAEGVLKVVCKDACFGGGFFRRPFGRYGLERLSVRDGLGGKSGGNDAFE